jgi:hypothetical protein
MLRDEKEESILFQNTGQYLPDYMESHQNTIIFTATTVRIS